MSPEDTPAEKRRSHATLLVFGHIKAGLPPSLLWKDNTLTEPQVKCALTRLRRLKAIGKVGYGTWEALMESLPERRSRKAPHVTGTYTPQEGSKEGKKTRGHGFVAEMKIPRLRGWENRKEILEKAGIGFVPFDAQKMQRIRVGEIEKVWLCPDSVVFYMKNKDFFAVNALKASWDAMDFLLTHVRKLEGILGLGLGRLKINKRYWIKFSRSHYSLIKNALAKQYNDEKKKLYVFDERGLWLLFDFSEGVDEMEFVRNETNIPESEFFHRWYNEMNELRPMPKFILNALSRNTQDIGKLAEAMTAQAQNMESYSQNLVSHVEAIKTLGSKTEAFSSAVDAFRQEAFDLFTRMNEKLEKLFNKTYKPAETQTEGYEMVEVEFVMPNPEFHGIIGGQPHIYKERTIQMGRHIFLEKNTAIALEKKKIVKMV